MRLLLSAITPTLTCRASVDFQSISLCCVCLLCLDLSSRAVPMVSSPDISSICTTILTCDPDLLYRLLLSITAAHLDHKSVELKKNLL